MCEIRAILAASALLAAFTAPVDASLPLWPMPQVVDDAGATFTLDASNFTFSASSASSDTLQRAFQRYQAIMRYPPLVPQGSTQQAGALSGAIVSSATVAVRDSNVPLTLHVDESYALTVAAPTCTITANTVWGALRALETLSQLTFAVAGAPTDCAGCQVSRRPSGAASAAFIRGATVKDVPRFSHRGIMIDTARHFLPLPTILEMLDAMSYSKFSVLHWHLVDDQVRAGGCFDAVLARRWRADGISQSPAVLPLRVAALPRTVCQGRVQ